MTAQQLSALYLLALCVWRESRGESVRGKALVAQTIRNRVEDVRWPSTYTGVITQPKQFSAFNVGDPNATKFPAEDDPSWLESVQVAAAVLDEPVTATRANHYHVAGITPDWADVTKIVAREGAHVFYAL